MLGVEEGSVTCHVDLWQNNLTPLVEVYCCEHGLLKVAELAEARAIQAAHNTDPARQPIVTSSDASVSTADDRRVRVYPYQDTTGVSSAVETFLAYAVKCLVAGCGWLDADWSFPGTAADCGRGHLRSVHA